jgi:hypothetical protein
MFTFLILKGQIEFIFFKLKAIQGMEIIIAFYIDLCFMSNQIKNITS